MSTEEKVEMESVPLKSDTDTLLVGETTETAPAAPETITVQKKQFFHFLKKTKKPAGDAEAQTALTIEGGDVPLAIEDKPKKCKKQCWWNRGQKSENEQKAEQISIGINLVDRDEKSINEHVKLDFHDIFGEADTNHSWDFTWRMLYKVFSWVRCFIYRLFTLILVIPAAVVFGILFALLTVLNTFVCLPTGKLLLIPGNWLAKIWSWVIHAVFDPITSSLGLFFASFTIRKYGINSQPTDLA